MQLSPLKLPAQLIQPTLWVQGPDTSAHYLPSLYLVSPARESFNKPKGATQLQMCMKHGQAGNYNPWGCMKYKYAFWKATVTRFNDPTQGPHTWETFYRSTNKKWLEANIRRGVVGGRPRQVLLSVTQLQDMFPSGNFGGLFYGNLFVEKDCQTFSKKEIPVCSLFKPWLQELLVF